MIRHITISTVFVLLFTGISYADTFKHRETGKVFNGFATQKSIGNRTRVYNADDQIFKPIVLAEYDVRPNAKGRRNNVIVIGLKQAEVLLSQVVSETLSNVIVDASNKGPRFIVIEIDHPGGRGDYMKDISTTISKTFNCPTVAYISGGEYGGAYSAATAVALACDRIYIAPTAVMASVAPTISITAGYEDPQAAVETYSPKNLSAYGNYVAVLAESKNRPSAIAMAMLDRSIEVLEVADRNGNRLFVNRTDRRPDQSVIRTLTKTAGQGGETVLTLTPNDLVAGGVAEKVVGSLSELIADMGAADAKLIRGGQVDKTIRKFVAARRNLVEILASTDYLQKRADELEQQLNEREKQILQDTRQLEYRRQNYSRGDRRDFWAEDNARGRRRRSETEIVTGSAPMVNTLTLRNELALVLNDLIRGYNRAIALGRRWPGALGQDMTLEILDERLVTARTLQNDVVFRRGGIAAPGGGFTPGAGSRLNRGTGYTR